MSAMASSSVSALTTVRTGPKISCLQSARHCQLCSSLTVRFDEDGPPQRKTTLAGRAKGGETRNALVAVHLGRRLEDRRADKVAVRVPVDLDAAPVEEDLAALLLARLDERLDALLCRGRDERATASSRHALAAHPVVRERARADAHFGRRVKAVADLERLCTLDERVDPVLRVADGHDCKQIVSMSSISPREDE